MPINHQAITDGESKSPPSTSILSTTHFHLFTFRIHHHFFFIFSFWGVINHNCHFRLYVLYSIISNPYFFSFRNTLILYWDCFIMRQFQLGLRKSFKKIIITLYNSNFIVYLYFLLMSCWYKLVSRWYGLLLEYELLNLFNFWL